MRATESRNASSSRRGVPVTAQFVCLYEEEWMHVINLGGTAGFENKSCPFYIGARLFYFCGGMGNAVIETMAKAEGTYSSLKQYLNNMKEGTYHEKIH